MTIDNPQNKWTPPADGVVTDEKQSWTPPSDGFVESQIAQEPVEPTEEDYFKNSFGDVLRGFDTIVPLGIGDFVDDMARSVASGYRQGTAAEEADKLLLQGTKATPEQIQQFINARKDLAALGPSKEMQDYQNIYEKEGKGFWGVIKGLASNPTVIPELMASSLTAMATNADALTAGAAAVGTGTGIGAAAGTAAGGVGAIPGAITGAATSLPYAFGLASSVVEAGSTFGELLEEELNGREMTKESVKQILEDPEKLQSIRNKAIARGIVIGTVDALTGKLASGVGAKVIKKGVEKSATGVATKGTLAKAAGVGSAIEALGGSAGEAAARGAIGQEMDVSEIALEGISELPGGIRSTATALITSPVEQKVRRIEQTIDRVADTGSPEINQQIDSDATYDQEGPQPEGRGTETETGGVLQVSPETPGAQEEVGDVTVGEVLDKSGVYQGKKGLFYKDPEGQAILFKPENENRVYEVGNIDEISNKPISDFGIEYTESVVGTTETGNFTVRGNEYVNKYSDPLMAINQDKAGNIVSVNLETTDGKKRTFRGNIAEDLAYQIKLKQITQNNEQLRRFEEFINTPEVATQISGLPEVTAQETTGITQQVPTTQPAGQVKPAVTPTSVTTKPTTVTPAEDLEAEGLRELEQLEQPTPQPTVEQPTTEQAVTEQPVTPQPEVPTAEQPANLNDFKRYFFNKDPKAFGGNLGTALGMSQVGWQKAYNKFAKTATPEEIRMLDALRGKEVAVQPQVEEQVTEEEVILIDKTALLNAGYTNEQIKLVEDNPEKFGQIDDKIVNLETNEVIKPTGKKKVQVRPKRRPKETFPKKTYADLEKAMFTPGVKLDELLRIVIGMNNDYSALAEQLLNIYKSNKTVRLAKFDTNRLSGRSEKGAWGVYRSYNNTVAVFVNDIKEFWKNRAKVGKISPREVQPETESSVSRILLHEIVHAYTVKQIYNAIPAARSRNAQVRALQAYLKHGDNQGIKDIITLYLSAREQTKDLEKKVESNAIDTEDWNLVFISEEAGGTKAYGLKNIKEFLTEAFTQTEFQRLLNRLESPIAPKKSTWQSFVDAVKKILRIATTGAKELSPVKAGSILESVLRVAPDIMITDQEARTGDFTEEVDMSPAPQDPRTAALIKIAQGLINKGATPENVIQQVKDLVTPKFNIDVDAYAQDILAGINVRREAVAGPFNADTEVANVATSPYNQILTSQKPDNVSAADFKQQKVEAVADFLRGKATSKEQVQDFALAWNDSNPNNPISRAIANEAWDRLKTARPQPAATTTVKINDMIRTQAQIRAKGKAEGVRETTKQFREKLIKMVQDAIKASNLTRNQINSMLSAVKRVNLFTAGSINKLADRIAKLEADAAYADKVNQAKSLRSKIVSLARPKEAKVSNYTETARNFLKVDIDYLTTYAEEGYGSVDPLDDYIKVATAITNGFANPKLDRYERIIVSNVQDYINTQLANKEKEVYREMLEGIDEESLSKVVEGASLQEWQKLLDTLQLQDRATELQEELRTMDNPEGILNTLNSANLEELTADELSTFVMVADNIIANEDYSMVDSFSNKIKARDQVTELKKSLGSVTKDKLVSGLKNLQQITQMLDAVFNFSKYAAVMYNLSGIYDYISATARVENRKIATGKMIEDEMDRIDSKVMGVPSLRLETEQGKLAILSELAKYTVDSTEHMEKVKENLQLSIDRWKEKDPEFGDKMQKIYDGYKNVNSAEEAVEAFKKNDPHVHQLWEFISTKVFTKQLTDEVALNTRSVHNKVFVPFVNYMPTSLKTMEVEAAAPEQQRMSAKPVQSGTTKEAKRVLSIKQAYDFKDYINGLMYAYTETIHDIETSKHLQLFNYIANNPEFVNLIGGSDNKNAIVNRVIATDKIERRMGDQVDESLGFLNNIANGLSQVGVTTALGGLDQIALQYPSAAASALIMLGGDADLFFAAPTSLNDNLKKLLASQDISVRGQAHKYELSSQVFDLQSKNEIMRGIGKLRKGMAFIQKDLILKPLIMSDVSVAQRSYIAFYLKSLKDQGITAVDLSSEFEKRNEPSRKQALAYASLMLSNLQVASTSAGRSAFLQTPGNLGIIRKLIFPFSSFPINTKIRMIRALNKMKSSPNKSEGARELLAVMTEAATFSSIKIYLLPFYYAAVKAGMEAIAGFEAPEEEEDDEDKNWRKFKTQMALEAIPFNVGSVGAFGSQWTVNRLNYMLSETEARTVNEFLGDMGEDPMFERLQNWNKYNDFYGYGQFGIGMDRYADILNAGVNYFNDDYVTLDNGYREQIVEKDSDEIDRMALMNLIIQLSPSPREVRNQMNKIQREQFKMARERQKEESQ